jgi:hypothetical protein
MWRVTTAGIKISLNCVNIVLGGPTFVISGLVDQDMATRLVFCKVVGFKQAGSKWEKEYWSLSMKKVGHNRVHYNPNGPPSAS